MAIKKFTLRMEEDLLNKLQYIAKSEARSINGELTMLAQKRIEEFEARHGNVEEV